MYNNIRVFVELWLKPFNGDNLRLHLDASSTRRLKVALTNTECRPCQLDTVEKALSAIHYMAPLYNGDHNMDCLRRCRLHLIAALTHRFSSSTALFSLAEPICRKLCIIDRDAYSRSCAGGCGTRRADAVSRDTRLPWIRLIGYDGFHRQCRKP